MARSRRKRRDVALYCDILGVLLLFISATMFVSLLTSDSGILGHAMATFLRMIAGVGAYVLPLAVAAIGVIFLIGPFLPASRNAAIGAGRKGGRAFARRCELRRRRALLGESRK